LITAEQIEICDSTCTGEVEFMGIIPELEQEGYTTQLWACGSNRFAERDIASIANRVIQLLRYKGPLKEEDLISELSFRDKLDTFQYELIRNMAKTKLLEKREQDWITPGIELGLGKIEDPEKEARKQVQVLDHEYITNLRKLYTYKTMKDLLLHAAMDLTDLHPFQIDFRIKWIGISKKLEERLQPLLKILGGNKEEE
jgi:hypothetical protein